MHVTLKPTLKVQTKLLSYSSSDVLPCYAPSIFARAPALIDGISTAIIHDELVPLEQGESSQEPSEIIC